MVNAPLRHIRRPGLLWQIDADELWTAQQIITVRRMFLTDPGRMATGNRCWFFVGPDLVLECNDRHANPDRGWRRTWRHEPGMRWAQHEPPHLVKPHPDGRWLDLSRMRPFTPVETEAAGLVFQHFAYARVDQVQFKESYYGYAGAVSQWRSLQACTETSRCRPAPCYFPFMQKSTLLVTMILFTLGCGGAAEESAAKRSPGKVQAVKGSLEIVRGTETIAVAAGQSQELQVGDTLRTAADGEAVIVSGPHVQVIGPDSETKLEGADEETGRPSKMSLLKGFATYLFPPANDKKVRFEASTSTVVAAVRGTIFQVKIEGTESRVSVVRGEVAVRPPGTEGDGTSVKASQTAVTESGEIKVDVLPPADADAIRTDLMKRRTDLGIDISTF